MSLARDEADVFEAIDRRINAAAKGTYLLAVTGPDCSGKTMFAASLADRLSARRPTTVVHVDDFHFERAHRYAGSDEVDNYLNRSFNFALLEQEVLRPLKETGQVRFARTLLDLATDTLTRRVEFNVEAGSIVIVEGVFLLQRRLAAYWNLSVFLLVDKDVALGRGLSRDAALLRDDVERRYREKYLPAQERHMSIETPLAGADLIINNNDPQRPLLVSSATDAWHNAGWRPDSGN